MATSGKETAHIRALIVSNKSILRNPWEQDLKRVTQIDSAIAKENVNTEDLWRLCKIFPRSIWHMYFGAVQGLDFRLAPAHFDLSM